MKDKMKIALAGIFAHSIGTLLEIKDDPGITIASFCPCRSGEQADSDIRKLRSMGFSPDVFADYEEMLIKSPAVVVIIDGPFQSHAKMASSALKKGYHVYCEKPVALELNELNELYDTWQKSGKRLTAMMNIRANPAFWTAAKTVHQGGIGAVRNITARKSYKLGIRPDYFKSRKSYGGTIPWVGIHAVDWVAWFSGKKFTSVTARHTASGNHNNGNLEVSAACLFELEDEITAIVSIDYLRPSSAETHGDDRIRIAGDAGVIEVALGRVHLIDNSGGGEGELELETPPNLFVQFLGELTGVRDVSSGSPSGRYNKLVPTEIEVFAVTRAVLLARDSADLKKSLLLS
jgi:predicted dehydrogenase